MPARIIQVSTVINKDTDHFHGGVGTPRNALRTIPASPIPENILFRHLDTVGDGTGDKNAIGDYSGTPTEFKYTAPANTEVVLNRMVATIRDDGTWRTEHYAGLASELTNGIEIYVTDDTDARIVDLTDGRPMICNGCWSRFDNRMSLFTFGAGDTYLSASLQLDNFRLPSGYSLNILMQDSMATIIFQIFQIRGYIDKIGSAE